MEKFNLDKKESNLTTSPEPVPTPKIKPQEKNETENFISEKIDLWNKLIVDNPVLSIEEKGDALERVRMFSKVVLDNKALYDKYKSIPGGEKILIQKIFDTAETPKWDISMEFKNGIIVFTIPKDELFSDPDIISQIEKVQGFLKLKVPIDSQEYPFMVLRKGVATQKVFEHELQHFYNSTLQAIPKDDNVFSYMGKLLADETIAQSIDGSYGNEFSDFLIGFSQGLSIDSMHWNYAKNISYSFGNRMSDPLMKKRVNIWLMQQDCSLPWILRDKKIKNYADILALTPFEKRDDLESYFSKQENTELSK